MAEHPPKKSPSESAAAPSPSVSRPPPLPARKPLPPRATSPAPPTVSSGLRPPRAAPEQAAPSAQFGPEAPTLVNAPARPVHAPAASPPPPPSARLAEASPASPLAGLDEELRDRIVLLEAGEDRVSLARAHVERSLVAELSGDLALARAAAKTALAVGGGVGAAHRLLRRYDHGRANLTSMLGHLEHEISAASGASRAELIAEKARLLQALGTRPDEARHAWELTLAHEPLHAAALKGLETELAMQARPGATKDYEALVEHLARMAEAYLGDRALAAWLHVERADVLERRLGRALPAREALEIALSLDGRIGPVRDALVRHVSRHQDFAALVRLFDEEALLETSALRSARLELDAATIASARLGAPAQALRLLARAFARAPTTETIDACVLDKLVFHAELAGDVPLAMRARRARLAHAADPRSRAHELRTLAALSEGAGDVDQAILDLEAARALDMADATLPEELDRLLASARRHDDRVALRLALAARCDDARGRARLLARAAQICERELGRPRDAITHLRTAWVASPSDPVVQDALGRLLVPEPPEATRAEARLLASFYAQAADSAADPSRRVAFLEKAAFVYEDLLGEPAAAAQSFERILALEPDRRGAVLGLARVSLSAGDDEALARARLVEARLAKDPAAGRDLRIRAAEVLAKTDAARAMALVEAVLADDPLHDDARLLETRLHEQGQRWQKAADSIRARIQGTPAPTAAAALWIAHAVIAETRLSDTRTAVASYTAARALDPSHPVPPAAIARLLAVAGDLAALRRSLQELADAATTPEARARHLLAAAELSELSLADAAGAERTYRAALAEVEDELIAERLTRVLERTVVAGASPSGGADGDPVARFLASRVALAVGGAAAASASFRLAARLVEIDQDPETAASFLDSVLAEDPGHSAALRLSEALARARGDWRALSVALARQSEAFADVVARRGSLWALAPVEEWRLGERPLVAFARLRELAPGDTGALEGLARLGLSSPGRDRDAEARLLSALRELAAQATEDEARWVSELFLGLLLDASGAEDLVREAEGRYRAALALDPRSLVAARGALRLSSLLADAEGTLSASLALADLAPQPQDRASHLLTAANILLRLAEAGESDARARAVLLLERGLREDPDSAEVAARLATIRLEDGQPEAVIDAFRAAMARARPASVVRLGSEVARVAQRVVHDVNVAVEAMRKVRAVAPDDVPSLRTLADLYVAAQSWPEAVEVLEHITGLAHADLEAQLGAYFSLATLYDRALARPDDAECALRQALAMSPDHPHILRELVKLHRVARAGGRLANTEREEMCGMLRALADDEANGEARSELLLELAEVSVELGDRPKAAAALVEALARAPSQERAWGRLAAFHGGSLEAYAAALARVIELGAKLGRTEPTWLAALGQIEVEHLGNVRDGIQHLQRATRMEPRLHEARLVLAQAFAKAGAPSESALSVIDLLVPDARPLLALASPSTALQLLEQQLSLAGRAEHALVVTEIRCVAGEVDDGRQASLRARRLGPFAGAALDRAALVQHLVPTEARHALLQVAGAISGVEEKMLRSDIERLGISPKARIGARSGHPTRLLLDRVARSLGVPELELVVSTAVETPRLMVRDEPWVVLPPGFVDLPEPTQLAGLARVLSPAAWGMAWLDEVSPDRSLALLVAAARRAGVEYALGQLDDNAERLADSYEPALARALSRSQRRALEDLAPVLSLPQSKPPRPDVLSRAMTRARARAAFVVTGDLLATIDDARTCDAALDRAAGSFGPPALVAVLTHPVTSDVCGFALSGEATALRRRIGSMWTA